MDHRELAVDLVARARAAGADAADVLVAEGTEFSVTVRKQEIETLTEAGSKALGLRVFVGRRTANAHTSDFSPTALRTLVEETVTMARATGEDPAAGLPDECPPAEDIDLGLYDASLDSVPAAERIEWARRAEAAALDASPQITNSEGASWDSGQGAVVLANSNGFLGSYRSSSVSVSVVPVAEKDGQKERDYWWSAGRGVSELLAPEEIGRIAAERTLRRLGARQAATAEVPVVFDPLTAADLLGSVFGAISGYAVFRNATFLEGCLGQTVASPLLSVVDEGRRPRGHGSRPFDGEGLATRRTVLVGEGVLETYLLDSYSARKLGLRSTHHAARDGSGVGVSTTNLVLQPGTASPESLIASVKNGFYVTELIGFGINGVTGDFSKGAAGLWIENGRLSYPVAEVTVAGNLLEMLAAIEGVGNDLVMRDRTVAPTVLIGRMVVAGE